MTASEFRTLIEGYEGKITEGGDNVQIASNNVIIGYYEDGTIWRKSKVECKVGYGKIRNTLFGEEATYEILGGECGGEPLRENAVRLLNKYNFRRKQGYEQMSLF